MICLEFKETGSVPMDCVFGNCTRGCKMDVSRAPSQAGVECHRCGETGLEWLRYWDGAGKERWKLASTAGLPHVCRSTASTDEFPDLG